MREKKIGIYKITSPSGKVYIGQSNDIQSRFNKYKRLGCGRQTRLHASFLKYGVESHEFEIIIECLSSELDEQEIKYIKHYESTKKNKGLNLKEGGAYGKHSEETKKKIGLAHKGKVVSGKARENMRIGQKKIRKQKSENASRWQTGRKLGESHKENIKKALIGNQYSKGNKWTEEQRERMAGLHNGNKYNVGRKKSEAERERLSTLHKGKPKTREQKIKIGIAGKRTKFLSTQNPNQLSLL